MPPERLDASYINKANKIAVLDIIRNSETISRAELAKRAHLSPPTISRIVDSLINQEHMVNELGIGSSDGGRPPNLISFSGADKYIIGIDLGTTHIDGIVTDLDAKVIAETWLPADVQSGYSEMVGRTAGLVNEIVRSSGVSEERILGIGMAVAGLVDREKRQVEFSPDFSWRDVDVGRDLRREIPYPVVYDNVTRVMALGELHFGMGREFDNFICINIGYGIGAGIIIDGKPFFGTHGMSGEFGHTVVERESSVRCMCGNYGCLEALASGHGIAMAAQRGLASGETSILTSMTGGNPGAITAETVADAASRGDRLATGVLETAANYIGLGVINLVNLFDPQAIIIGGGVAGAGALLFDTVRRVVSERSLSRHSREIVIAPSSFGGKASVMGAISLVLNEVLALNLSVSAR